MLCGIAGALYVPQVGIINPSEMSPANSIEIAIWTAVGGRGTLVGADRSARSSSTAPRAGSPQAFPEFWLFFLGLLFILVTLFLPRGVDRPAAAEAAMSAAGHAHERRRRARRDGGIARRTSRRRGHARRRRRGVDTTHGPILYLDGITVSFDGFKALNDLSLTIEDGELRCIIGPNGAGKTTMMDVITGKTRPDAGTAFFGQTIDLTQLTEPEIAHAGIGRKFQKPTVFEQHTVFENLELAMKADKRVRGDAARAARRRRARPHRRDARR